VADVAAMAGVRPAAFLPGRRLVTLVGGRRGVRPVGGRGRRGDVLSVVIGMGGGLLGFMMVLHFNLL